MDEIEFRDPPPPRVGGRPRVWEPLLAPLTEHPGRWAVVRTYEADYLAATDAARLRSGRVPLPPGRWEFTSRRTSDGGSELFARFLGVIKSVAS